MPSKYSANGDFYSFDPTTKSILESLVKTKDVMKINIKNEAYLDDAFVGFVMGVFGNQMDLNKAKGLNNLINKLPVR